ncbi:hypothetical protein E2C01_055859 [Portunus trituberculatus]|uniref:Lipoprotein n=1 Tax=Portunus trituberculatus TaxID=210409 RepID=A0A5B7GVW4_PORTR|nr:hypothetical protein [Portunus trituberculatus]
MADLTRSGGAVGVAVVGLLGGCGVVVAGLWKGCYGVARGYGVSVSWECQERGREDKVAETTLTEIAPPEKPAEA